MTYQIKFRRKANYLHAIVTGQNRFENIKEYLQQIIHECKTANCSRLLIEERLEGPRLDTLEVFGIASEESGRVFGVCLRLRHPCCCGGQFTGVLYDRCWSA